MKALATKSVGITLLCALTLAGCNNKDKEETKTETAPPVTQISKLSCDDASIKNGLLKELTSVVEGHIVGSLDDFDDAKALDLEKHIKDRLPEIGVDLQNVRTENGLCLTDLHITLPKADLGYANRYFKAQDEPSIGEQAEEAGVEFTENTFIAPISYRVDGGDVKLDGQPAVLSLVATASGAAAYTVAKNARGGNDTPKASTSNNSNGTAKNNVAPAPAVKPRPPKPAETTNKPVSQAPKATDRPRTNSDNDESRSGSASQSDKNTARTEPRPEPKSEPKSEPRAEPKSEPRSEPKSEPKPEPKSEPKSAVKDTTSEITITESDDTY